MKQLHYNLMFYFGCVVAFLFLLAALGTGVVISACVASIALTTYYPFAAMDWAVNKYRSLKWKKS